MIECLVKQVGVECLCSKDGCDVWTVPGEMAKCKILNSPRTVKSIRIYRRCGFC